MKTLKKILKVTIKWGLILGGSYWFFTTLILGDSSIDWQKGYYHYRWSGLDALFNEEQFGFATDQKFEIDLHGLDGPYIVDGYQFRVDDQNQLKKLPLNSSAKLMIWVNNSERDAFEVGLRPLHLVQPDQYQMPSKLIAISDLEGNFNGFYSFLINNKIMNDRYQWTFGNGHLVLNGDFVDRGESVTQVLWLIYMLEQKAEAQGGKVHFLLGNHEIMNLYGEISYNDLKYVEVARQISGEQDWDLAVQYLFSERSEMGKWLRTKNIVEKIGNYIFVHGGLKPHHVKAELSIAEMNHIARKYYGSAPKASTQNLKEEMVLSNFHSPYWDRSYSMNWLYKSAFFVNAPFRAPLHKTTQEELELTLEYYQASKMVIGHSVVDDISADYNHRLIKIDVKHGQEKNSGATKGLLIENGTEYKVDDLGQKTQL